MPRAEDREGEKRRDPDDRTPVPVCSDWAMPRMPGITAVCGRAKAGAASARIAVALCLGWLAGGTHWPASASQGISG